MKKTSYMIMKAEKSRKKSKKMDLILFGNTEYRVLLTNDADREIKDNVHILMLNY